MLYLYLYSSISVPYSRSRTWESCTIMHYCVWLVAAPNDFTSSHVVEYVINAHDFHLYAHSLWCRRFSLTPCSPYFTRFRSFTSFSFPRSHLRAIHMLHILHVVVVHLGSKFVIQIYINTRDTIVFHINGYYFTNMHCTGTFKTQQTVCNVNWWYWIHLVSHT